MAIKFFNSIDVDGEVQGTSLDINGNADISGNLTGVDTLTAQDFVGTGSYHEFGNATGSVSNNGTWHGRLNVAGIAHARIDVKDVSDGIITTMFAHTGQGAGKLGTYSNHPVHLVVNGTSRATLDSSANFAVAGELEGGSLDINGNADISGNITSANWTGDVIASAYLDSDTAHLSGTQTFSGNKTFSADATFSGVLDITNSTEATDSTGDTGALRVEGGISSAGHVYAEGLMSQMGRSQIDEESKAYPIGHYTTGKDVFSIDPTWTQQQLQELFNSTSVTWATETDAPSGWSVLITGSVGVGIPYGSTFPLIPIDDTAVYFTECWIKNVGTAQTHYMGSAEKDEDFGAPSTGEGNTGSYGYHVMSNTNPGNSWTRVTGHITGRSATASGAFETDANYFSPLALFNYTAGSGTRACLISGWRITKIDKQEYFADGTAALPAITNYNDTDTGIYWNATNEISLTTGGTNRLTINSTRALFSAEVEATSLDINGQANIGGDIILDAGGNSTSAGIGNSGNYLHFQAKSGDTSKPQFWMGNHSDTGVYTNASTHYWRKIDSTNIATLTTGQFTVTGEIEATSLDINGNADISGNLSGVNTLTATTLSVTNYGLASGDIPNNAANTSGSSGSCTGNAATATTATNSNNVKTTSVSNSTDYFGVFVDSNGTAYQDLHVGAGLKYNPSTNILTAGKLATDTVAIVENAKSTGPDGTAGAGQACMTITGAGAGNESNISLKIAGTAHGSPAKLKIVAETTGGDASGNGLLSYHPTTDTFGIGQTTTHNSMAILIDNNDVVSMKNQTTFTNGIDVTSAVQSTSKTTGTVKIAGGVGIAKTLNVGEDVVAYASSDKRYKDNLQAITNPIDKVKSLTGYTFTWNDKHKQFNGNNDIGVVAQEVEKILPEIVDTRDDGYKAVKYEKMVALLIEAVKDQQTQIDDLKTIIDGYSK